MNNRIRFVYTEPLLTPWSKAKYENLENFGIMASEIDTSSRMIKSASSRKAAIILIHTDSTMKLRIRLLENPPDEPKHFHERHITAQLSCGVSKLSLGPNGTLTPLRKDDNTITVVKAFLHQSRVFYINEYSRSFHEILSDDGKFFTSLPDYFRKYFSWDSSDFISYDKKLLMVPHNHKLPFNAMLISEDFFREYDIIPGNEHLTSNQAFQDSLLHDAFSRMKSILTFNNELLAITKWGTQFYDDQIWKDFEIEWAGLTANLDLLHFKIQLMVVHTKHGDKLIALGG